MTTMMGAQSSARRRRPGRWLTFGTKPSRAVGVQAARVIVLAFLLGQGVDVVAAVMALLAKGFSGGSGGTDNEHSLWAGYIVVVTLAVAAAVLGMRTARLAPLSVTAVDLGLVRPRDLPVRRAWAAAAAYAAVLGAAIWVTVEVADILGVHGTGVSAVQGRSSAEVFHVAAAGLAEEPVLLALPLALAARVRWPWWAVYLLVAALRISFHVYYGWLALFVLPWIAAAMLLWRWCPLLLWPFVLGHGLFDMLQYLEGAGDTRVSVTASVVSIAVYVVCGLVAAVATMRWGWTWLGRRARELRGNDSCGRRRARVQHRRHKPGSAAGVAPLLTRCDRDPSAHRGEIAS